MGLIGKSVLVVGAASAASATLPPGYHPVVVSGPFLGQNLEFSNDDESSWCFTNGTWRWIWGNPNISSSEIPCLLDSQQLAGWDSEKNLSIPKPHVSIRPKGGYEGNGLEAIGTFGAKTFLSGGNVDDHMGPRLRALGYVDGESFIGHGYDYRLAVGDWQLTAFPVLRRLIETATRKANAKAVLAGLSMAGPYLHSFISWANSVSPGWGQRHIHAFVPVASPWNGAVFAVSAVISSILQTQNQSEWTLEGECPRCDPAKATRPVSDDVVGDWKSWASKAASHKLDEGLQASTWTWPALYFMATGVDHSTVPPTDPVVVTMKNGEAPQQCSPSVPLTSQCGADQTREGRKFDNPQYLTHTQCAQCYNMVTVIGRRECSTGYDKASSGELTSLCCKRLQCEPRSYRASEIPDLLEKVGRMDAAKMMRYALSVPTSLDPGVPVHCIFAENIQTFATITMNTSEDVGRKAMITLDGGDQIVNSDSLEVCTRWPSTLKAYRIPGGRHGHMYDIEQVIDVIEAVATNNDRKWRDWRQPAMSELKVTSNKTLVRKDFLVISGDPAPLNLLV